MRRRRGGPESSLAHAATKGSGAHGAIDANEAVLVYNKTHAQALPEADARPNHVKTHQVSDARADAETGPHAQAHAEADTRPDISSQYIITILCSYTCTGTGTDINTRTSDETRGPRARQTM